MACDGHSSGAPRERTHSREDGLSTSPELSWQDTSICLAIDSYSYQPVSHLLYDGQDKVPRKDSVTLLTSEDIWCTREFRNQDDLDYKI